ncbi:MAG: hypothetical protein HY794_12440 [Desulfarculus sp.]|nr:hypothetical protein [Desulfarculus sp.]
MKITPTANIDPKLIRTLVTEINKMENVHAIIEGGIEFKSAEPPSYIEFFNNLAGWSPFIIFAGVFLKKIANNMADDMYSYVKSLLGKPKSGKNNIEVFCSEVETIRSHTESPIGILIIAEISDGVALRYLMEKDQNANERTILHCALLFYHLEAIVRDAHNILLNHEGIIGDIYCEILNPSIIKLKWVTMSGYGEKLLPLNKAP